jgi:TRAP-type mannitol/chloroaromatic compound transport system permease large subunit
VNAKVAPGLPAEDIGHREADGSRGLRSLGVLTVLSVLFAAWMLQGSHFSGIDRAILGMTWGISFALFAALVNRTLKHFTGRGLLSVLAERVTFVMVPPLLLIFLVLGTILIGVATPTEGGAMGAVGALLLAAGKRIGDNDPRRFNVQIVRQAAEATAKLAAFVMFILIGARIFSLTFYGVNGHIWVEHLLTSLPGGMYGFLIAINVLIFFLAFFLDFFELAFILVPLLKPAAEAIFRAAPEAVAIAKSLGFAVIATTDASGAVTETVADVTPFVIWLGVLLAINMQTSFMHPPFGFALFYLRSVAPRETYRDKVTGRAMAPVKTSEIYWGAVPFLGIQLLMVAIVLAFPHLVMRKAEAPKALPAAAAGPHTPGATHGQGFSLPPWPPLIEDAPDAPHQGPGAPTLDMRDLPSLSAPERPLPRTGP